MKNKGGTRKTVYTLALHELGVLYAQRTFADIFERMFMGRSSFMRSFVMFSRDIPILDFVLLMVFLFGVIALFLGHHTEWLLN